jgi:prepilin-type N-terminal cleavage/methylation domain-containing protein
MSKGFTLIEMVLVVIVLAILSGFTFSVIWQYSRIYADTKGGYVYGEASAVLERMSRELRDAGDVDTTPFGTSNPAQYINFSLNHGTPQGNTTLVPPYWVQYCICTPSLGTRSLYMIRAVSNPTTDACVNSCPPGGSAVMSRNIMSSGFQVKYFQNSTGTVEDDSYEITLKLARDGSANNPSITLVTRVSPRNYMGLSTGRSFSGGYYDEIN